MADEPTGKAPELSVFWLLETIHHPFQGFYDALMQQMAPIVAADRHAVLPDTPRFRKVTATSVCPNGCCAYSLELHMRPATVKEALMCQALPAGGSAKTLVRDENADPLPGTKLH